MNYTENYHLPQWVKDDRIMMEDFNDAMANIEDGMSNAVTQAQKGLNDAAGALQEETNSRKAAGEIADRRIFRLLYNQYLAAQSMETIPERLGMFYQNPCDPTKPVAGTAWRDGALFMTAAQHYMTGEQFFAGFSSVSEMDMVRGDLSTCVPLVSTFTTPGPGLIHRLQMTIEYTNQAAPSTNPTPFLLELKNMDTEKVEWAKRLEYDLSGSKNIYGSDLPKIPFQGNTHYQLTAKLLSATVTTCTARFQPESDRSTVGFYNNFPGAAFTQQCRNQEKFAEGVIIVRCKPCGDGKSMVLRWNGEVMQPSLIRELPATDDPDVLHWNMQEMFFHKKGPIPIDNDISLTFQCDKNSEFWFYDWGGIFF